MTLDELFSALTAGEVTPEVELAVRARCDEVARRQGWDDPIALAASATVARRLLTRARRGLLGVVDRPTAYLAQAIRFAAFDAFRKQNRASAHADSVRARRPDTTVTDVEPIPTSHPLLFRVFEEALSYRQLRYHASLHETWDEQCQLHSTGVRLRTILAGKLELPPDDPKVDRAIAAAHKRHQRLFRELRLALDTMRDSDMLAGFEYEVGLRQIHRLKRRETSAFAPDGAPDGGGDA